MLLHLWKQEEVRRCEIRRKERVSDKRDDAGGQPVLGGGDINDGKIFQPQISVKNGPDGLMVKSDKPWG